MNVHSKTLAAPSVHGGRTPESFAQLAARVRDTVALWHARARQRRTLSELSPELLDDVGLSAEQVRAESRKPFWRV